MAVLKSDSFPKFIVNKIKSAVIKAAQVAGPCLEREVSVRVSVSECEGQCWCVCQSWCQCEGQWVISDD